ncbi:MAG: hypothetical protein OHK0047_14510 [Leptolyngbyaceae cyanobacterium]
MVASIEDSDLSGSTPCDSDRVAVVPAHPDRGDITTARSGDHTAQCGGRLFARAGSGYNGGAHYDKMAAIVEQSHHNFCPGIGVPPYRAF